MAENPIRKEDIIDGAGITQSIQEIINILQVELVGAMKSVTKEATEMKASLTAVNTTTKEGQNQTQAAAEKTQQLSDQKKILLKLEKDLEKANAQYNALRTTEGKILSDQIRKTKEATKAMQDSRKELDHAEGSYNALNKRLNDLIKQYKAATGAQRDGLTPEIKKLDKELKSLDANIGRHQRNVGNYTDAMTALPGPMGRAAMGAKQLGVALKALMLNPIVLLITAIVGAIAGLVSAFKSSDSGATEFAARFEQIKAIIDVVRQRLIAVTDAIGNVFKGNWKEAAADMKEAFTGIGQQLKDATKAAYDYQYALDRIEDTENNYVSKSAENRNKIAKLEFTAQDRTKSAEERRKALAEAIRIGEEEVKELQRIARDKLDTEAKYLAEKSGMRGDEVISFVRMTDAEQANASESLKTLRNNNEAKFAEIEKLYAAWIDLDTKFYDENKRNMSRMTGFEETIRKEEEDRIKTAQENRQKESDERIAFNKKTADAIKNVTITAAKDEQVQLADIANAEVATEEEKQKRITELNQKYAGQRMQAAMKEANEILQIVGGGITAISDLYSAQKQRELNAAGDNAKKREEIERKYFKKEQSLSIAQAVINGALAVTKVEAQTGVLSFLTIPLIVAQTLAQIAVIASQKFAKGGFTGKGRRRDETGERVAGVVHEDEFVIDKKKTKKYRGLLEAIHRDDKLAIAAELNNSNIVWARTADMMKHQDPFTEKMYNLMQKNPTVYNDSNDNTVLLYPDGRKRIIRRNKTTYPTMIKG